MSKTSFAAQICIFHILTKNLLFIGTAGSYGKHKEFELLTAKISRILNISVIKNTGKIKYANTALAALICVFINFLVKNPLFINTINSILER